MCILAKIMQRKATQSSLIRRSRTQRFQQIVITVTNAGQDVAGTSAYNLAADPPAVRAEGETAPSAMKQPDMDRDGTLLGFVPSAAVVDCQPQ
jgi:hypothetical protein